ncbi:GRAM-domain-containing protein, partial [Agrocybe pediades]
MLAGGDAPKPTDSLYSNAWSEADETIYDDSNGSIDSTISDKAALAEAFAAANSKKNQEFHELFPQVPASDHLIEEHGCAIGKQILHHGRMYISVQHVSFNSNIFGWVTNLSIPMTDIVKLEKANTALIIPNAILITTEEQEYFFASFLFRDSAFETIEKIWALAKPRIEEAISTKDGKRSDSYDFNEVLDTHATVKPQLKAIETLLPAVTDARSAEEAFAASEHEN